MWHTVIPNKDEWLDVWESGRKVGLFSRRLKIASSSTTASSGSLPLLFIESGIETQPGREEYFKYHTLSINAHTRDVMRTDTHNTIQYYDEKKNRQYAFF